jgi:hypothetical protein
MVTILPPRERKENFGSIIGRGVGEFLQQRAQNKMQKEAEQAKLASQKELLSHEYGLKGGLEEKKQAAKFAEQIKMMKELGLDLTDDQERPQQNNSLQDIGFEEEQSPQTPTQKRQLIPQEKINAMALINPAVADKLQKFNDQIREQKRHEENISLKQKQIERKEQLEFHKESSKFDEKLTSESSAAEKKIRAINKQRELQPTITNFDRIVASTFKDTRFENLLKSKSAQEFDSLALPMVEGQKETFGVRLSDADLRLILQKIATADRNPEANAAILNYMELEEKLKLEKRRIADQIKKDNKGLRPLDYESMIRQRLSEKFGNEIEDAASKVLSLTDDERKREILTERKKVPQGTPLHKDIIDKYLKISGNDAQKASRMAQEDGYEF